MSEGTSMFRCRGCGNSGVNIMGAPCVCRESWPSKVQLPGCNPFPAAPGPFPGMTLEESYPETEVPANRVLIAFRNDDEGIAFREWWNCEGVAAFAQWRRVKARLDALEATAEAAPETGRCLQCQGEYPVGELFVGPDPYLSEICDKHDETVLCPSCWQNSNDEI